MKEAVLDRIRQEKIIAVVRGVSGETCVKLARALYRGGIGLMELPFDPLDEADRCRTEETLRLLNRELGDTMTFGAGTVTEVGLVERAVKAGAAFLVSPNTDRAVIEATRAAGAVSIPGAFTPTEIKLARDCGGDLIKVFPARALGPTYFKDLQAPLKDCPLLAVGGITAENIADYLAAGCVGAAVSGDLVHRDWIRAGRWDLLEAHAALMKAAAQTGGGHE